jgi:hypothetical protein
MTWRQSELQRSLWPKEVSTPEDHSGKAIFEKVFRALRPRTPLPEFDVRFRPYADVNNVIRVRDGKVVVGLSDLLQTAPEIVIEAIAAILLSKLYRKPIPEHYESCYRRYLNRHSVRSQAQTMRRERGRKWISTAKGQHFDLEEIFTALNRDYFDNGLKRPRLSWSRSASRTLLGHFDTTHDAIIISRIFDRPQMPRVLVEYIMYHEMLHLKHPVQHKRERRCFHSPQFRSDEKKFARYSEAKLLIERL